MSVIINDFTVGRAHEAAVHLAASLETVRVMVYNLGEKTLSKDALEQIDEETTNLGSLVHCLEVTARSVSDELDKLNCYMQRTGFAIRDGEVFFKKD
jgi:Formyltetrahydrofolate synthetase